MFEHNEAQVYAKGPQNRAPKNTLKLEIRCSLMQRVEVSVQVTSRYCTQNQEGQQHPAANETAPPRLVAVVNGEGGKKCSPCD